MTTTDGPLSRVVFWAPIDRPGFEHLRLCAADGGFVAAGVVMGVDMAIPFRLHYKIKGDAGWNTRKVILEIHTQSGETLRTLRSNGQGRWRTDRGEEIAQLEGCRDVDISATPFTNTLAINRLKLKPGQQAKIRAVYVKVPSLAIRPVEQRYTAVEATARGGRVLYEGLFRNFRAELAVDADGLVLDYPEAFRRVYPV
ncbi:MAG: putative glycolipid-binding domain-containing protein [Candidatus Binatia bacterium]